MQAGNLDKRLSKFSRNVWLSVQQECPLLSLRWYQMLVPEELPEFAASAESRRQCISSPCLCGFPTPSPSAEWTSPEAWPVARPSISPVAGTSASAAMRLPADIRPPCTSVTPSMGSAYNPMNDGGRYTIRSPILSDPPPTRPTLSPPLTLFGVGRGSRHYPSTGVSR